jgi:hypothetical protein
MQGHIHKRVHTCKAGTQTIRWYVVVAVEPDLDGRLRQKWRGGFRTRREAEVVGARLVNDLHNHRYVIPARLTLRAWMHDSWLPMMQTHVKPTTFRGYRQVMESHVLPVIGDRPIQKLRPRELEPLYAELIRGGRSGRPLSLITDRLVVCPIHDPRSPAP